MAQITSTKLILVISILLNLWVFVILSKFQNQIKKQQETINSLTILKDTVFLKNKNVIVIKDRMVFGSFTEFNSK